MQNYGLIGCGDDDDDEDDDDDVDDDDDDDDDDDGMAMKMILMPMVMMVILLLMMKNKKKHVHRPMDSQSWMKETYMPWRDATWRYVTKNTTFYTFRGGKCNIRKCSVCKTLVLMVDMVDI